MKRLLLGALALVLMWTGLPAAQEAPGPVRTYQMPPESLAKLVDAPLTPAISLAPGDRWMLIMERRVLRTIAELAQPELRLAGLRINPRTNGPSRYSTTISSLRFHSLTGDEEHAVEGLPEGAIIDDVTWSPNGEYIAFTINDGSNIELWMAETKDGKSKRVMRQRLNAAVGQPYRWLADSRTIVARIVPEERGDAPRMALAPAGPTIQENLEGKSPARTYQDLLENAHDEAVFEHIMQGQLLRVDAKGGKRERLGEPGLIVGFDPSPNGKYIHVEQIHRPFSYLVPYYRFPRQVQVWDLEGRMVAQLADTPLHEGVPTAFGSVPTGPRDYEWRDDAGAVMTWVEAQDGGDAGVEAELRDKLFALPDPFTGPPTELLALEQRFGGVQWGSGELALAYSWWWKTRNVKTMRIRPDSPQTAVEVIFDRSWEDRYNDPGEFMTEQDARGRSVLLTANDGQTLFLQGEGASDEGDRPFFDRFDLANGQTERLWRSEAPYYEMVVDMLDVNTMQIVTRRESVEEPPDYYIRDLLGGQLTELTDFPHPHPELTGVVKEIVQYERADGVKLNGTLYLPPGYDPATDGRLPVLLWAYPQEFKSADAAGQLDDSPYRFDRVGWWSPLAWVTRGYAVFDDPKLPIVGEGDAEPNDTFVAQLVSGAQAAVDVLVEKGVGDADRMAIGGHSYGAFMTANLLAHSDIFRAGIARSGAYNRTLTPFGFQAEERTLWQAPEVYFGMSPFMHAEKVDEPILLIHGEADNNAGTYPMQSERYYDALKGLGATARMVMLPHESHGYRARESINHLLWETDRWLEQYVKNAGPRKPAEGEDTSAAEPK